MEAIPQIQPKLWFDVTRHPALQLGPFILPAYMVPVITSLLLPICHRLQNKLVKPNAEPSVEGKTHKTASDLENNDSSSESKERTPRHIKVLHFLLSVYHQTWSFRCLMFIGSFKDDFDGWMTALCLSQTVAICITGYFFDIDLRACIFATAGWIGLAVQNPPGAPAAIIIAVLALPYAFQRCPKLILAPEMSGGLLLVLICNYFIPQNSLLRMVTVFNCELWPAVVLLFGLAKEGFKRCPQDSESKPESQPGLAGAADNAGVGTAELLSILLLCVAVGACLVIPTAIGWVISSFNFSCLGWRWVVDGFPAKPPSIGGAGFLGGFAFLIAWTVRVWMGDGTPEKEDGPLAFLVHQLALSAVAMTWATASFTILYLALLGISLARGPGQDPCALEAVI